MERYLSPEATDLTLFHYDGCLYCGDVKEALARLGVVVRERNILAEPDARRELLDARGRATVPVLRIAPDAARDGASLHGQGGDDEASYLGESQDIIRYLDTRFGDGADGEPGLLARAGGLHRILAVAMWAAFAAGAVIHRLQLPLWTLAMGAAATRSALAYRRTGGAVHLVIGAVFGVATLSFAVRAGGGPVVPWEWLAFGAIGALALSAWRRR